MISPKRNAAMLTGCQALGDEPLDTVSMLYEEPLNTRLAVGGYPLGKLLVIGPTLQRHCTLAMDYNVRRWSSWPQSTHGPDRMPGA